MRDILSLISLLLFYLLLSDGFFVYSKTHLPVEDTVDGVGGWCRTGT